MADEFLSNSNVKLTEFQRIKLLGCGSFGKVFLVKRKDKVYAMKILKKHEIDKRNQRQHTYYERIILAKIDSPFVVRLQYAF